jgi:hypothetical protein
MDAMTKTDYTGLFERYEALLAKRSCAEVASGMRRRCERNPDLEAGLRDFETALLHVGASVEDEPYDEGLARQPETEQGEPAAPETDEPEATEPEAEPELQDWSDEQGSGLEGELPEGGR